jgi:hypothetical protein
MEIEDKCLSVLQEEAAHLKSMSYGELLSLAEKSEMERSFRLSNRGWMRYGRLGDSAREIQIDGKTLYLDTLISACGLLRKRVVVELTMIAAKEEDHRVVGSVYFERFRSGQLREPTLRLWLLLIFCILVVGIVAALVAW